MSDPYICAACGGNIDKKGFCEECGAQAGDKMRPGTCPECGKFKPNDDRVQAGMKCAECAGYGLMRAYERDRESCAIGMDGQEPAGSEPEHYFIDIHR